MTLHFIRLERQISLGNYKLTKKVYSGKIKINEEYWKLNSDFTLNKIKNNITASLYDVNDILLGPSNLLE